MTVDSIRVEHDLSVIMTSVAGDELLRGDFPRSTAVSQLKRELREYIPDGRMNVVFKDRQICDHTTLEDMHYQAGDHLQVIFEPGDGLTEMQIENLKMAFDAIDAHGTGFVGILQLVNCLRSVEEMEEMDIGEPWAYLKLLEYGDVQIDLDTYIDLVGNRSPASTPSSTMSIGGPYDFF
eukprot:TRINITY_DN21165_c0_g1_i1.p1 TRINITY_DN21165_c0_g1~~TRINITY_DN21165_c0_g1_i1.p1  ORF type:complete len:179 (-),score=24.52 TRINITY_DN21165_c0_g1_i1:433-969(-)